MKGRLLAVLGLFLASTVWGVSFVLVKDILPLVSTERFIFWRFLLGGLILVLFAARFRRFSRTQLLPGMGLGLLVFAGYWLQTRGLAQISASRSAFLTGLAVVMVPILDRAIYRTAISRSSLLSAPLAATGTFFLVRGFDGNVTRADILTILCAMMFALHLVLSARLSRSSSSLGLSAIQVSMVALASVPFVVHQGHASMSRPVVMTILFTGVMTTAMTFWLLMWSQARLSATEAAVILAFEPVAACMAALLIGDDHLTLSFVLGASLILLAMLLSQIGIARTPLPGDPAQLADPAQSSAAAAPMPERYDGSPHAMSRSRKGGREACRHGFW